MIQQISRIEDDPRPPARRPNEPANSGFKRCLNLICNQWFKPINVGHLVAASRMSPRGLFKAFRRHTGESPGQALRRIRMERARQLLRRTDWSTEVIAGVCGFRSVNTFAVAFRREMGLSPGQFRRAHSGRRLEKPRQ